MPTCHLPDTADLQAFVAVAQRRSFSAAARALNIPRQTLTRRVERLEESLGTPLLKRTTDRFQLTEVGEAFVTQAVEALQVLTHLVEGLQERTQQLQGVLRVSTMPLEWGPLREMIQDFTLQNPKLQVEILSTTRHVDMVQERFDVVIRGGTVFPDQLITRPLGTVSHVVMASPRYLDSHGFPTSLDDLRQHRLIGSYHEDGSAETRWPMRDGSHFSFQPTFSTNDLVMRRDAAIQGLGIAFLPDLAVASSLESGALKVIMNDVIGTDANFAILYLEKRLVRPAVRAFIDFAVEWVERETTWLDR